MQHRFKSFLGHFWPLLSQHHTLKTYSRVSQHQLEFFRSLMTAADCSIFECAEPGATSTLCVWCLMAQCDIYLAFSLSCSLFSACCRLANEFSVRRMLPVELEDSSWIFPTSALTSVANFLELACLCWLFRQLVNFDSLSVIIPDIIDCSPRVFGPTCSFWDWSCSSLYRSIDYLRSRILSFDLVFSSSFANIFVS